MYILRLNDEEYRCISIDASVGKRENNLGRGGPLTTSLRREVFGCVAKQSSVSLLHCS